MRRSSWGSNNAVYGHGGRAALDAYVRRGGGVLFISDGNFGSSWADSPSSDNSFLAPYGMEFNQDNGQYILSRSAGDFIDPTNPILIGVDAFDGEGVSPIRLTKPVVTQLVGARGTTFDNNPTSTANHSRGTERPVDGRDASLDTAVVGSGRVAAFFRPKHFFQRQRRRHGHHKERQPAAGDQPVQLGGRPHTAGGSQLRFCTVHDDASRSAWTTIWAARWNAPTFGCATAGPARGSPAKISRSPSATATGSPTWPSRSSPAWRPARTSCRSIAARSRMTPTTSAPARFGTRSRFCRHRRSSFPLAPSLA